jgi:hypothetical protein
VPERGGDRFASLGQAAQRKVLGPGKLALYEAGRLELDDLVVVTSSRFGRGRREASIRELRQRRAA